MKRFNKPMIVAAAFVGLVLFTSDAQAQRRGGFGARGAAFLIAAPEVQQDLKLSDQQKQDVAKVREDQQEARRSLRDIEDREERTAKARELNEQAVAAINKVLNEEQQKRFAQIQLQQDARGELTRVLLRDEIASKLKLTDEQSGKLRTIQRETAEATRDLRQGLRDASQEQRREAFTKIRELTTEANQKALGALTGDQKEQWSGMLGKPLEIQFQRRRGNQ